MTAPTRPTISTTERSAMPNITDEYMREMLGKTRTYTAVLLRKTEEATRPGAGAIVWEHGRRNFALRAAGTLPVVCPAIDASDWAGIGIFDATLEEVEQIMQDDPGVRAGIFTYELHPVRGFPSSSLP